MTKFCLLLMSVFSTVCCANDYEWVKSVQAISRASFTGVSFSTSFTGLIVSSDGNILRTVNAGGEWSSVYRRKGSWNRIASRGNIVAVIGEGKIAVSTDSGATFTDSKPSNWVTLKGVDIDEAGNIWVCGMIGRILHAKAGSTVWIDESLGNPQSLYFIKTLHSGLILAGGRGGLSVRTLEGKWVPSAMKNRSGIIDADEDSRGETWILARNRDIVSVIRCKDIIRGCGKISDDEGDFDRLFAGDDDLWLTGEAGALMRMPKDRPLLQIEKLSGNKVSINASCLAPDGEVWAVGEKGAIFRGIQTASGSLK